MKSHHHPLYLYVRVSLALSAFFISQAGAFAQAAPISISSVSLIYDTGAQTINITGTGFGMLAPYNGDSPYIQLLDSTAPWSAGNIGSLSNNTTNLVTLDIASWADTQISIGGITGDYGSFYKLTPGDQVTITVVNPQTSNQASFGPITVLSAIPEPSSYAAILGVLTFALAVIRWKRTPA